MSVSLFATLITNHLLINFKYLHNKYDELSVKTLLPEWQANPEFWVYFPDKMPKDRVPDRDYFFTILNTLQPDYVDAMI